MNDASITAAAPLLPVRQDVAPAPPRAALLPYEQPTEDISAADRPRWVYAVVAAYVLLVAGIVTFVVVGPAWGDADLLASASIGIGVMLACGAALVLVPVRTRGRRPIQRRSLWPALIASGFLGGLLVLGVAMALAEFTRLPDTVGIALAGAAVVWAGWALLFWFSTSDADASRLGNRLHRYLLAGSVLELIVAVPTHVIVRRRDECCAGIATGMAICIGVAVAVIAFGPSVVLLYYRRWRRVSGKS